MNYLSLKEIQYEEFKILQDFDTFCRDNSLRYSLDGGTLLGAVRHKGFIPWDDDIDVCMPRPDYERFLSIAESLPRKYSVVTMSNSEWPQPFCKIQNTEIRAQEPNLAGIMEEFLWIDIFPFDGFIEDSRLFSKTYHAIRKATKVAARFTYGPDASASHFKRMLKYALLHLPGKRLLVNKAKEAIELEVSKLPYTESERVFCYANQFENMVVDRNEFEQSVLLPFEEGVFPCMSCWDTILQLHYGDYMQIPKESERVVHHMKCWRV